jgi:hypothetical protein
VPKRRNAVAHWRWSKVNHSIRRCLDEDDAEWLDGKVLLVREVPVHRNECVEGALHPTQKYAVLDTIPTKAADSLGGNDR